jgi:hypothetical protein
MARYSFIDSQKPEQDDPQAQEQVPSSFAASGASGASGAAPAKAATGPSGRFMDIQRMLYANKGQGQKLAQGAIDTASSLAARAQGQLNSANQAYQTQVKAGTPKAFSGYTPPPVQSAAGAPRPATPAMNPWTGATQVEPTGGSWGGFTAKGPAATPANQTLPGARPTTTLNTIAPTAEQAQAAADARYTGPHSLTDTQGVDPAALSASFQNAYQAGQALGSPSILAHQSGGIGAFNDLLARSEAGGELNSARQRFSGIRDQLSKALTNTAPADAAAAQAAATQAAGTKELARQAQETADETQRQTDEANAAFTGQQDRDNTYQTALSRGALTDPMLRQQLGITSFNAFNSTVNGMPLKDWWDANWERIQPILKQRGIK